MSYIYRIIHSSIVVTKLQIPGEGVPIEAENIIVPMERLTQNSDFAIRNETLDSDAGADSKAFPVTEVTEWTVAKVGSRQPKLYQGNEKDIGVAARCPRPVQQNAIPEVHQGIAASSIPIPLKTIFQNWKDRQVELHQYSPTDLQVVYHRRSGHVETTSPVKPPIEYEDNSAESSDKIKADSSSISVSGNIDCLESFEAYKTTSANVLMENIPAKKSQNFKNIPAVDKSHNKQITKSTNKMSLSAIMASQPDTYPNELNLAHNLSKTTKTGNIATTQVNLDWNHILGPPTSTKTKTSLKMQNRNIVNPFVVSNKANQTTIENQNLVNSESQTVPYEVSKSTKGIQTETRKTVTSLENQCNNLVASIAKEIQTDENRIPEIRVKKSTGSQTETLLGIFQTTATQTKHNSPKLIEVTTNTQVNDLIDSFTETEHSMLYCASCDSMQEQVLELEEKTKTLVALLKSTEEDLKNSKNHILRLSTENDSLKFSEADAAENCSLCLARKSKTFDGMIDPNVSEVEDLKINKDFLDQTVELNASKEQLKMLEDWKKQSENKFMEFERIIKLKEDENFQLKVRSQELQTQIDSFQCGMSRLWTAIERPVNEFQRVSEEKVQETLKKAENIISSYPESQERVKKINEQLSSMLETSSNGKETTSAFSD